MAASYKNKKGGRALSTKSKAKDSKKKLGENLVYDFVKVTGLIPAMIIMRPRIIHVGKHKSLRGGYLASANHCSFLDPIFLQCVFWKRRSYSLATKDLYKNKFMTWLLKHVHCIQVDKENFSLNSFHEVTKQLKRGKPVIIFPEGQVNLASKDMLAFKTGIILMANTAKAPIVPVYLVRPKKWYSKRVALIGDPINISELCGRMPTMDDLNRAADFVQQKQRELEEYYYTEICPDKKKAEEKEESKK